LPSVHLTRPDFVACNLEALPGILPRGCVEGHAGTRLGYQGREDAQKAFALADNYIFDGSPELTRACSPIEITNNTLVVELRFADRGHERQVCSGFLRARKFGFGKASFTMAISRS